MIKKALFLILMGALCVTTVLVSTAKAQGSFKENGKQPEVAFQASIPDGLAYANLSPAQFPDGTWGYFAEIHWIDPTPHQIAGIVPAYALKAKGPSGSVQVYVTRQMFSQPTGYLHEDFASLAGTFTPYTGNNSDTSIENGKYLDTHTNSDGSQVIIRFNGKTEQQSSTFEGTLETNYNKTYSLSVQNPTGADYISILVGVDSFTIVPAP